MWIVQPACTLDEGVLLPADNANGLHSSDAYSFQLKFFVSASCVRECVMSARGLHLPVDQVVRSSIPHQGGIEKQLISVASLTV